MQQVINKWVVKNIRPAKLGLALAFVATAGAFKAQGRPLPPLDRSKGLYIRKDGTRVYKDPAPPTGHVYTYRGHNGTVVRHYTGVHYGGAHPKPRHHVHAHGKRRHARHH